MSDEKKHWLESRAKRFTVYGAAFLMLLAVSAGIVGLVVKGYAVAQKVEVYVGLPDWLKAVEKQVKDNGDKLDDLDEKVEKIGETLEELKHQREHGAGPTTE